MKSLCRLTSEGLFKIKELRNADGFITLRDKTFGQATKLVDEILSKPPKSSQVLPLFDELSNTLCKVADLAEFVRHGHSQPKFKAMAEQTSVAISFLVEKLNTNKELYDALKNSSPINELDSHVTKLFLSDFEQSGIHLDEYKRNKVLLLNNEIMKYGSLFNANVGEGRLVQESLVPNKYRNYFPKRLNNHIFVDHLYAESEDETLREIGYKLFMSHDQVQDDILKKLLQNRLELAKLCGFESYAHRAISGSIAASPLVVEDFLNILSQRIKKLAQTDFDHMLDIKAIHVPGSKKLNAWDVPYYNSQYKKSVYEQNISQCLPYFSLNSCIHGLNLIFNKLYGVKMYLEPCENGELWHNDVTKYSIVDTSNNEFLGHIYCDLIEREQKQNQDCHHTVRGSCQLRDGNYQTPIVVLTLNLSEPNDENPSLLTPSMVDNLFHEMGHAMHSMMARTKYQHISGTRCSTDLAEVPSILMEFFASDPRVISMFARHHATGENIPSQLVNFWVESKRVFSASDIQMQVFYAALDQAYHGSVLSDSTISLLVKNQSKYYSIPYVEGTAWQLRFTHLVGYGAKYYSYLVSRAIAGAIWSKMFAADPLSRSAGERFKNEVLVHGGGKPALNIAEDVLGVPINAEFIASSIEKTLKK